MSSSIRISSEQGPAYFENTFKEYSQNVGEETRQEEGHIQERKPDCNKQGSTDQRVPASVFQTHTPADGPLATF